MSEGYEPGSYKHPEWRAPVVCVFCNDKYGRHYVGCPDGNEVTC